MARRWRRPLLAPQKPPTFLIHFFYGFWIWFHSETLHHQACIIRQAAGPSGQSIGHQKARNMDVFAVPSCFQTRRKYDSPARSSLILPLAVFIFSSVQIGGSLEHTCLESTARPSGKTVRISFKDWPSHNVVRWVMSFLLQDRLGHEVVFVDR